jgi:hypothetical protein
MELAAKHNVRRSRIIIDDDGVGGGVVDQISGAVPFVNNSRPVESKDRHEKKPNYANLKSQCYFKLAEHLNAGKISCYKELPAILKESLIEELEQVRQKNPDKDGPLAVVGKDEVKERLGRSPDLSDAMMMRMYFEFKKSVAAAVVGLPMSRMDTKLFDTLHDPSARNMLQ